MEQTQYIDIALIPDENDGNPRKITKAGIDRLKKSIKENSDFFEARPILLNRKENGELQIIGGHQRLRAARELKLEKVPAFVFDNLDEETAKRYTILDNDNEGKWDFKLLQDFGVNLDDFNVSIPESIDYDEVTALDVLNAIIYKPSKTPANVSDFLDNEDYDKIKAEIEKIQIPDELKCFVDIRLNSFRRFRFDKIADYYARADEQKKLLFRQLALVFDISGTSFERDLFDFYNVALENPDIYDE